MDIAKSKVVIAGKSWEKDLPELDDLEVLVAPWENATFNRILQKKQAALPPALRADGIVEPAAYYRCVGQAIAEAILFDWKNFQEDGVERKFDRKYAAELLTNPEYKPFRDGVVAASRRVQQGIRKEEEELAKNSEASSPGSASGEATRQA